MADRALLGNGAEPALKDDRDLLCLRADTTFPYDACGKMLHTNEPCEEARRPAPRLFLGRTTTSAIVRFGATVPDELMRELEALLDRLPPDGDLRAPPPGLEAVRAALARHAPSTAGVGGPAYRFPPPPHAPAWPCG